MRGVWRITVVVALAVVACAWAVVSLQDRTAIAATGCGNHIQNVPGYTATVVTQPNPPSANGTNVVVALQRDGQPLSGASVCLSVDMIGMPMGDISYHAQEESPGRYNVVTTFTGMQGTWRGNLVVSADGGPVLARLLTFRVS